MAGIKIQAQLITMPTSTGEQTITFSGMAEAPKAVLFLYSFGRALDTRIAGVGWGVGMTDGTNHRTLGGGSKNNVSLGLSSPLSDTGNLNTSSANSNNNVITLVRAANTGIQNAEAEFVSVGTSGLGNVDGEIVIDWTKVQTNNQQIIVVAFAGSDLSAKVGTVTTSGSVNGIVDYTGVGFEADQLITVCNYTAMDDASDDDNYLSLGIVSNIRGGLQSQASMNWHDAHGMSFTDTVKTGSRLDTTYAYHKILADSGSTGVAGGLYDFDSSGFNVITKFEAESVELNYLALKYGATDGEYDSQIIDFQSPSSPGPLSSGSTNYRPRFVFAFHSNQAAVDTNKFDSEGEIFGYGVFTRDFEASVSAVSDAGVTTTNNDSMVDDIFVHTISPNTGEQHEGTVLTGNGAITNTGFDVDWLTTSGAVQFYGLVVSAAILNRVSSVDATSTFDSTASVVTIVSATSQVDITAGVDSTATLKLDAGASQVDATSDLVSAANAVYGSRVAQVDATAGLTSVSTTKVSAGTSVVEATSDLTSAANIVRSAISQVDITSDFISLVSSTIEAVSSILLQADFVTLPTHLIHPTSSTDSTADFTSAKSVIYGSRISQVDATAGISSFATRVIDSLSQVDGTSDFVSLANIVFSVASSVDVTSDLISAASALRYEIATVDLVSDFVSAAIRRHFSVSSVDSVSDLDSVANAIFGSRVSQVDIVSDFFSSADEEISAFSTVGLTSDFVSQATRKTQALSSADAASDFISSWSAVYGSRLSQIDATSDLVSTATRKILSLISSVDAVSDFASVVSQVESALSQVDITADLTSISNLVFGRVSSVDLVSDFSSVNTKLLLAISSTSVTSDLDSVANTIFGSRVSQVDIVSGFLSSADEGISAFSTVEITFGFISAATRSLFSVSSTGIQSDLISTRSVIYQSLISQVDLTSDFISDAELAGTEVSSQVDLTSDFSSVANVLFSRVSSVDTQALFVSTSNLIRYMISVLSVAADFTSVAEGALILMPTQYQRIQRKLLEMVKSSTFPKVTYNRDNGDATVNENSPIPPASVLCDEVRSRFDVAKLHRQTFRLERTKWPWEVQVHFNTKVSLEIFEQAVTLNPPSLPRTDDLDQQVRLILKDARYTHPPEHSSADGTHAVFDFEAELSPV